MMPGPGVPFANVARQEETARVLMQEQQDRLVSDLRKRFGDRLVLEWQHDSLLLTQIGIWSNADTQDLQAILAGMA